MGRHRDGRLTGGRQSPAELGGEEQVGQLGGAVVQPCVADAVAGHVVKGDLSAAVQQGGDGHHPRTRRGHEPVEQQAGQGEVPQVVGGHLQLEAVGRLPVGRAHHAGVVDQQVEMGVPVDRKAAAAWRTE